MAVTAAQDVLGFGRLGQMKVARRAEERQEKRLGIAERGAEQSYKLGRLQIKQMETNLQSIKRTAQLKEGLGKVMANIPEGENQFTTAYNYLMMSGATEEAQKYMDNQSDRIEQIYNMDPERGIDAYNKTIGKISGSNLKYEGEDKTYGAMFKAIDNKTKEEVYLQKTNKGFEKVEGYSPIPETGKEPTLKDKNLIVIDSLAKKIKDGTATPAEIQTYKLAESDYVEPKRIVDSVTGEVSLMQPTLPKGMPTFKEKEEGAEQQKNGHTEPLLSTGDFKIMPVSDPKRLSKSEISNYRTAANSLYLMKDMLTDLKDDIEKNGLRTLDVGLYADRNSNYWDILMRYKEVLNLGVLNGPDVEVMQNILKDPTAVKSIGLGKGWVIPGYENVIESLNRELNRMNEVTGGIVGKEGGDSNTAEDYMKKWSN